VNSRRIRLRDCRSEVIERSGGAPLTGNLPCHRQRHDLPLLRLFSPAHLLLLEADRRRSISTRKPAASRRSSFRSLGQAGKVDLIATAARRFEAVLFPVPAIFYSGRVRFSLEDLSNDHGAGFLSLAGITGANCPRAVMRRLLAILMDHLCNKAWTPLE
jgi:hypothetical protein